MAIERVDLPFKNGGYFHSFLYVYQKVINGNHSWKSMNRISCWAQNRKPTRFAATAMGPWLWRVPPIEISKTSSDKKGRFGRSLIQQSEHHQMCCCTGFLKNRDLPPKYSPSKFPIEYLIP